MRTKTAVKTVTVTKRFSGAGAADALATWAVMELAHAQTVEVRAVVEVQDAQRFTLECRECDEDAVVVTTAEKLDAVIDELGWEWQDSGTSKLRGYCPTCIEIRRQTVEAELRAEGGQ